MNVLLFAMPDLIPHFMEKTWKAPSLAIASLAGNLKGEHSVGCADLILRRDNVAGGVREAIDKMNPDLIGLSAMSFQYDTAVRVARLCRRFCPRAKIVLGGYHATLMSEELAAGADAELFDFFIRGEGEKSFSDLVNTLAAGGDLAGVSGLSYKADGKFVHNPRGELLGLSEIKIPDRSARVWKNYKFNFWQIDVIETSRGCKMKCTFCSMYHMYGRTFRTYSIERVIADIADSKAHGARYIAFADDNITLDVKRLEDLCDAIVEAGHNDINYIIQASCAGIASSETLSKKMAKAGFNIVFLGIENVSERNLRLMKKGNILELTKKAIKYLHDNNIMIVGGMIVGHADDTERDIRENYEFFDANDIDFYGDQIITPYPRTEMREELLRQNLVTNPDDYSKYNGFWANVRTNHLSADELLFLRWKYRKKVSTFFKTTPAFAANFPKAALLRKMLLIPFFRVKDFFHYRGKSERERFEMDMARSRKLNDFFS